ncbi:DUF4856 domain-containing protein [Algoriphagus sp. D3-2-R+10]|uniref:DUF4856 domain-containing protein n=1 Tax=Algoriphagus aurantiacus TaxID=3103948 RepID=UPI002B3E78A3|nr:DUF4856 domain-containing protein [Algoriphagus sp. D3-2-R+10]MEB2774335.1 DUF4856 domain-containing protein [Algoriphagus sp. D3-2-R+10]
MRVNYLPLIALAGIFFSCVEDDSVELPNLNTPDTYTFERDGISTVSYQGQTDRLNMLSEMKSYLTKGDNGTAISAQTLLDMYANANEPFESGDLNAATSKQLENKTNPADVDFFKGIMVDAADVSAEVATNGTVATEGVAGKIERGTSGKFININEKGWEFTQFIEKGLMGSVFYHQIFNAYLSDSKIGEDVDNENLVEGKNYTTLEHHWDEAFGYWGVPVDFPKGTPALPDSYKRFWANYTNGRDAMLNVNQPLMDAYILGRTAIVSNNHTVKNEQIVTIIDLHELVSAATAVHYINGSMNALSTGDSGNFFHSLSEGYAFVAALKHSPRKKITQATIDDILKVDFGVDGDFWTVTMAGLQNAKDKLTSAYPELKEIEDVL